MQSRILVVVTIGGKQIINSPRSQNNTKPLKIPINSNPGIQIADAHLSYSLVTLEELKS